MFVISAFPGVGKTHFHSLYPEVADSDSSLFPKDEFPDNYIAHIQGNIIEGIPTLVSSHLPVREAMIQASIPFILVYPDKSARDLYLQRYLVRGSHPAFITLLSMNWEEWITSCEKQIGCIHIKLRPDQYLTDVISLKHNQFYLHQ